MDYNWHVLFTAYLRRINSGQMDRYMTDKGLVLSCAPSYSPEEDAAAQALWNTEAAEAITEAALEAEALRCMAEVAWAHDLSLHPVLVVPVGPVLPVKKRRTKKSL